MRDMTNGSPLKLILRFAFPLLMGNILQQLYNIADAAIVGRFLGANALAAVGATSSVQFLILGFCIGACTGFCVPIAQRFGARDYSQMRKLVFNSIFLTAGIGVAVTTLCVLLCRTILHLLSTPADIWNDTYIYILVIFLGIPLTLLYNMTAGVLRAIGDSFTPFLFLAVSTVLNIVADWFCIVILQWGCFGAAIATVGSQALSGILCLLVIIRRYKIFHLQAEERQIDPKMAGELLLMGIPMGLQFSVTAIGSMVLQSADNALGSMYASAYTAAIRIKMFVMCPFDAVATGAATFCSQNYGAHEAGRVRRGYGIGIAVSSVYGCVAGACLILFGRRLCMIFLPASEKTILDAAALYLRTLGPFYSILGLLNVSRITVQALGGAARAMLSGVMEMIARISVVMLLVPLHGFVAVCYADPAAWMAANLYIVPTCLYMMFKLTGRTKRTKRLALLH